MTQDLQTAFQELKEQLKQALPKVKRIHHKLKSGEKLSVLEDVALNKYVRVINLVKASRKKGLF